MSADTRMASSLVTALYTVKPSTRNRPGERMPQVRGKKKKKTVRRREKEILGVSQCVSFAYISLVSWNAILSPRQQAESSRQTPASPTPPWETQSQEEQAASWIVLHNNMMDRPFSMFVPAEREDARVPSPPPSPLPNVPSAEKLPQRLVKG